MWIVLDISWKLFTLTRKNFSFYELKLFIHSVTWSEIFPLHSNGMEKSEKNFKKVVIIFIQLCMKNIALNKFTPR